MKSKRQLHKGRIRGAGVAASRRVAPDTHNIRTSRTSSRVAPDTHSVETTIKQKYIKKIFNKITHFYKKISAHNAYIMKTRPGSKWFFPKRQEMVDANIKFETLKTALRRCDIKRRLFLNQDINAEQWLNDFYSDIAYAYMNSNSYKDYLESVKSRKLEFFRFIEREYLPKYVMVYETDFKGDNYEFENISATDNTFYLSNGYYETVGDRTFVIRCNIPGDVFTIGCDILFKTYCSCGSINYPQPTDSTYLSRHWMFDDNGYRKLDADKAETLLHVMGTHPEAKYTLTPDVVEEIASYANP